MWPLGTFCWGVGGSVAVEVVALLGFYYTDPAALPRRYSKVGFWITRVVLALLGGALAVGYEIDQAILAFNIGAATPLIIASLARGVRLANGAQRLLRNGETEEVRRGEIRRPGSAGTPPPAARKSRTAGR